jgi:energy-coupling factor transporter ATP-binding protein EcfA2
MRLTFQKPFRSITGDVTTDELGNFIVISGPNGSGKSQLLEAIADGSLRVDDITEVNHQTIRLFSINQLVAPAEGAQATNSLASSWASFKGLVDQVTAEIRASGHQLDDAAVESQLVTRLVQQHGVLTQPGLEAMIKKAGKPLGDFTEWDFQRHAPLVYLRRDPFQPSITELFLTYQSRYTLNKFQQWLQEKGDPTAVTPLTDDEFEQRFGTPPWDLLDSILDLIGLDYEFIPPTGVAEHQNFTATLRHKQLGNEVRTEFLSSGEKTLLALAMSLYTGSELGEALQLPKVLLLDEPDASLHPQMANSLLRVARETFVARHGVKVLMTTHSPTTVALAPEESLHVMRRTPNPRLRKAADRDDALKSLTVGLSTLNVSTDNRRTIFVESEYDEAAYQELMRISDSHLQLEYSLEFVASGRGGQGNCEAVKYLVGKLRSAGNPNVAGVIDRDSREGAGDGLVFNPERYSIENLVFDPYIVGAYLLREGIVASEDLGLDSGVRHFGLGGAEAQAVIDSVSAKVGVAGGDQTATEYAGGFVAQVPDVWLTMQGHDLQGKLLETYQALKARERSLLLDVIRKGYGDLPGLIPRSALKLFEALGRPPT